MILFAIAPASADLPTVRVAVLQFGTLNWEMDVIRHHQLDHKYGFNLDVTPVVVRMPARWRCKAARWI